MDKKRSILNIKASIFFKILLLFTALLNRRFLIDYIGNDANGLNSLYTSIIGVLAVAELGVGSAITYCMYKPIVENNTEKIIGLYCLFKKLYLIIGSVILIAGLVLIPFIPYLAADYSSIGVNVYLTYFLMLLSTVITYLYSAKSSLFNAYKDNYIGTVITSSSHILRDIIQIFVLILFRSFVLYLIIKVLTCLIDWAATSFVAKRKYGKIFGIKIVIDSETKREVSKNVKAMFMHKIGNLLVNTADSIIISSFIGVIVLGKYSNYTVISTALTDLLILFFTPLTSIIGHMFVIEGKEKARNYFNFFHSFAFLLGLVFYLGYFAIADDLVSILFGRDLIMDKSISFIITLNIFIQFMRRPELVFRDASGVFYNDRWKPFFEGIVNVALSILFVNIFPDYLSVTGVIAATIVTNLLICHIIEPFVLYKYGFNSSTKAYYFKNYGFISLFVICLILMDVVSLSFDNKWIELLVNGSFSVLISGFTIILICVFDKNFRNEGKKFLLNVLKKKNFESERQGK